MDLGKIREEIDAIDDELIELFEKRMKTVTAVAEYKKANNMPVFHKGRERDIVRRLSAKVDPELAVYTKMLYNTLFDISRAYQCKKINDKSELAARIEQAIEETPKMIPADAVVACQGTEGAYSEAAAEKIFSNADIRYYKKFRDVFEAVKNGECRYGVLPIENSIHGSVTEVCDLLSEYSFSIVKSAKIQINHVLLAKKGTKQIKEIFSHSQAIGQCEHYLKSLDGVKVTVCENTAVAAKMVAESERDDVASISSDICAELYGLEIMNSNIKDSDNNYTRFICISKDMEIYPGADKITVLLKLKHKPGSLYNLISKFASIGVNLTKIESRPICGLDFEFMFLLDMNISIYSDGFLELITELENETAGFVFLGAYLES